MLRLFGRVDPAQVRDELVCPQCGYELRGVRGDVGTCPECGLTCDLAKLMMQQWTGPWHKTPGFRRLLWPLVWPGAGGWVVFIAFIVEHAVRGEFPWISLSLAVVLLAGWSWSMWRLRRVMPWPRAVGLSALAHVALATMIVGCLGVALLVIEGFVFNRFWVGSRFFTWIVPAVAMIVLARVIERYIASCCLRHYLVTSSAVP